MSAGLSEIFNDTEAHDDFEGEDENDVESREAVARCWRCRGESDIKGAACASCRDELYVERDATLKRTGKKYLFLPDESDGKAMVITCAECARDFEWSGGPGRGRRPLRCVKCREGNAKRASESRTRLPAKRPMRPPTTALAQPDANGKTRASGVASIPEFADAIRGEIEELETALAVRLRVIRAVEQYLASSGVPSEGDLR